MVTHRLERGTLLLALLFTFAAGSAGAAAGAWFAWRGAGELPDDGRARQIAATAFGADQQVEISRWDVLFDFDPPARSTTERIMVAVTGRDEYSSGWVRATLHSEQPSVMLAAARDRLAAGGWRVTAPGPAGRFAGTDGTHYVHASVTQEGAARLSIQRNPPADVVPFAVAGCLAGMVAAWLLTARVARRVERRPPTVQSLCATLAAFGAALLSIPSGLTATIMTGWVDGEPDAVDAPWMAYMMYGARFLVGGGVLLLLVVLIVAQSAPPERPHSHIDGIYSLP